MFTGKLRFVRCEDGLRPLALASALLLALSGAHEVEASTCASTDATRSSGCYATRNDAELTRLLVGTESQPFELPVVCGEVVESPDEARTILGGNACRGFRREGLAAMLNIRRSILFGDGLIPSDPARCFQTGTFRIVLRCGDIFVPGPSSPDPDDALSVTEETSVADLVKSANELCTLAACPSQEEQPCGTTIHALAGILEKINQSRSATGDDDEEGNPACSLCPGDSLPPVLFCPSGLLTFECEGPAGAPIQYEVFALDNCDPGPDISCFPPPGTVLPVGLQRTVNCEATDLKGNTSSCSFDVLVVDTTPPTLNCPAEPIVVDCIPGPENGAVVNYPEPTATDICDPDPTVVCAPPSGSFFPFGTTTVSCTATDDAGNEETCSFEVRVVEQTPTQLICSGDITVECTGPSGVTVDFPPPMFSATCNPPETPSCDPPSGSTFQLGVTTVTCSTLDLDGTPIQCQFDVDVVDTQKPLIICPQNMVVECASPAGTPVFFDVAASDVCDPAPAVACVPPSGSAFPPGETVVRCTATDASGNQSSCEFTVTVQDTTAPDITCPQGPITVDCKVQGDPTGAVVNYSGPDVTDNCDSDIGAVCDRVSGSVFPLGSTTVNCTATDDAGNQSGCSFEVQVVDDAPPALVCINDIVRECTSPEGAIVEYPLPTAPDECTQNPVIVCDPPSGSLFPIGTTAVSCTATDQSGNVSTCSFNVTVEDTTPPAIQCAPNMVVECASAEGTEAFFNVLAVDACDPAPAVSCNPPSGSLFAPGPTVVECTATDRFGNSSSCSFTVSVVDTLPPQISCPEEVRAECESPEGALVAFSVSAQDACEGAVNVVCDPPSGSLFPPGDSTVICTATDAAGNTNQCQFPVRVVDTTPPAITCSQTAIVVECDQPAGGTVQYPLPAVSDICDPSPEVVCDPPQNSVLPLGPNTITCTATDSSGNVGTCSFQVEVVDTALPALVCVETITRECSGPDGAVVDYPLPTASDICDVAPNLSCLPAPGSLFPMGETEVTCTADDQSGNMISCSFTIEVVDTTAPLIQCPADVVAFCSSPEGTPVSYAVTATDRCDPTPLVECDLPSGTLFPLGSSTVNCRATDSSGNVSTCSFTVTVVDESPPTISCPASFETECMEGGTALVEYPLPSVTDSCDSAPVVVCDPPSGTQLPPGAHAVTCTATDVSGNSSSCEFTVTVVDTTSPALVCPPDMRVECEGPDGAVVDYSLPVANDACEGQPPVQCVPPSGSLFALGSTEVVCTSTDSKGNTTNCSFVVTVVDTTAPSVVCPEPIVVECTEDGGATVDFETMVTDVCDPAPVLSCDRAPGSFFPLGQSVVTCGAIDASGNEGECSFTITVLDRTPPTLTCPPDMVVECPVTTETPRFPPGESLPPEACTTVVGYPAPEADDGCQSGSVQISCTPPSGTRLALGTHAVMCRARDASGNETTCSFNIQVVLDKRAFRRGDSNSDGSLDLADPIFEVNFLFLGGAEPECLDTADANDDGGLDIGDAVFLLAYQFQGGPPPPDPFGPLCGFDLTDNDGVSCERYRHCE